MFDLLQLDFTHIARSCRVAMDGDHTNMIVLPNHSDSDEANVGSSLGIELASIVRNYESLFMNVESKCQTPMVFLMPVIGLGNAGHYRDRPGFQR